MKQNAIATFKAKEIPFVRGNDFQQIPKTFVLDFKEVKGGQAFSDKSVYYNVLEIWAVWGNSCSKIIHTHKEKEKKGRKKEKKNQHQKKRSTIDTLKN